MIHSLDEQGAKIEIARMRNDPERGRVWPPEYVDLLVWRKAIADFAEVLRRHREQRLTPKPA